MSEPRRWYIVSMEDLPLVFRVICPLQVECFPVVELLLAVVLKESRTTLVCCTFNFHPLIPGTVTSRREDSISKRLR